VLSGCSSSAVAYIVGRRQVCRTGGACIVNDFKGNEWFCVKCDNVLLPGQSATVKSKRKRFRKLGKCNGIMLKCNTCEYENMIAKGPTQKEKSKERRLNSKKKRRVPVKNEEGALSVAAAKALGIVAACKEKNPQRTLLQKLAGEKEKPEEKKQSSSLQNFFMTLNARNKRGRR